MSVNLGKTGHGLQHPPDDHHINRPYWGHALSEKKKHNKFRFLFHYINGFGYTEEEE